MGERRVQRHHAASALASLCSDTAAASGAFLPAPFFLPSPSFLLPPSQQLQQKAFDSSSGAGVCLSLPPLQPR